MSLSFLEWLWWLGILLLLLSIDLFEGIGLAVCSCRVWGVFVSQVVCFVLKQFSFAMLVCTMYVNVHFTPGRGCSKEG